MKTASDGNPLHQAVIPAHARLSSPLGAASLAYTRLLASHVRDCFAPCGLFLLDLTFSPPTPMVFLSFEKFTNSLGEFVWRESIYSSIACFQICSFTAHLSFSIGSSNFFFNDWKCVCHHGNKSCSFFYVSFGPSDYIRVLLLFFKVCLLDITYTNVLPVTTLYLSYSFKLGISKSTCCRALL